MRTTARGQAMTKLTNIISPLKKCESKCNKPGRKQGKMPSAGLIRKVWVNRQSWELRGAQNRGRRRFGERESLSKQMSGKLKSVQKQ